MRISQQFGANKSVSQEKYLVSAGIVAPETELACLMLGFFKHLSWKAAVAWSMWFVRPLLWQFVGIGSDQINVYGIILHIAKWYWKKKKITLAAFQSHFAKWLCFPLTISRISCWLISDPWRFSKYELVSLDFWIEQLKVECAASGQTNSKFIFSCLFRSGFLYNLFLQEISHCKAAKCMALPESKHRVWLV